MPPIPWHNRIPRTRLYMTKQDLLGAMFKLLCGKLQAGKPVALFEKECAAMLGVERAVAASYARTCLYHLLKALNLPQGSEVILTPITIHDMINVILLLGLRPRFVDIDPKTYQIDPEALESAITSRTKAILVTHLFGIPSPMDRVVSLCEPKGIIVLEDASHAYNAALNGKPMGTFGDAGFFSLSSLKALSTGYGGIIVGRKRALLDQVSHSLEKLRKARTRDLLDIMVKNTIVAFATQRAIFSCLTFPAIRTLDKMSPTIVRKLQTDNPELVRLQEFPDTWLWQFSPLQSELGLKGIQRIKHDDIKRRAHAQILLDKLGPIAPERLPHPPPGSLSVYWRFPFRAPEGRKFARFMSDCGIDVTTTLLPCCNTLPVFKEFHEPMPHAERAVKEVYFLPAEPSLTEDQIHGMADAVTRFLNG